MNTMSTKSTITSSNPRLRVGDPSLRAPKSILVVDDNEDIRAFLKNALESAHYEVQTASEGAQAIALLTKHPADLLITDLFMPGQEGMETIWICKTRFPRIKIIAISAGGRGSLASAALLGIDATLPKPFTEDRLLDTVRRVLDQNQN